MNPTPSIIPAKRRVRRRPRTEQSSAAAPVALTLVGAELVIGDDDVSLRLTFDRAVNAAGMDASQITAEDTGGTGWSYVGTGAGSVEGDAVIVPLAQNGSASGPERMSATAMTGIVAADDGGTWSGVTDLGLPFP